MEPHLHIISGTAVVEDLSLLAILTYIWERKVLLTGFKIFEVVKKKIVMSYLRHSVFGYRLNICGWKYLLSKYAKHSLC
jgi:hypothetical protein